MGKEHWEEEFEPTQEEYLDAINSRTQSIYDFTKDLEDVIEDEHGRTIHSIDQTYKQVGNLADNIGIVQILNVISITLSIIVLYKVW